MKILISRYFSKSSGFILFIVLFCFLSISPLRGQGEPVALYLTWKNDPTTSMVIDWHILPDETTDSLLYYRKDTDTKWLRTVATKLEFPFSDRSIYRKEITGLSPDTRYAFKVGSFDRIYYFETMPSNIDKKPLMFAVGGDTYDRGHEARQIWMERMNKIVMQYKPKFIFWGGDLAYADGKPDQVWRWYGWFDAIKKTLIDDEGNVIPIIATIGNHESNKSIGSVDKKYWNKDSTRIALAPFFYQLLAFPGQPGYRVLDFGDYLSILSLDSDHSNPIIGEQTRWLKKTLRKRKNRPHVFPAYHVPAYPSVKPFDQKISVNVRENWTPLFDKFHVPMAFEFHDHVYKRTPLIKNNKVDPYGTMYIGDGGWGTQLKAPKSADTLWYIDKIVRERNAVLVSLYKTERHIRAVNEFGQIIDEYPDLFGEPSFTHPISSLLPKGGITMSAETAKRTGKVYVDSDYSGYSDGGFAWFDNKKDTSSLVWEVPVFSAEDFTLRFRYSYAGADSGHLQLLINDEIIEDEISFSSTENENKWKSSTMTNTFLKKGVNTIELRCLDGQKAPRIDRIEVFPGVH